MPVIALDTFTDPDRNLVDHTPDLGFGSWTHSGAADKWVISGNKAAKSFESSSIINYCRSGNDIADDNFEVFLDYTRPNGTDSAIERGGLYLLAHKTNDIALGEGVTLIFLRQNPSRVSLNIFRHDSSGAVVQSVLVVSNLLVGLNQSIRGGAIVSGLDVEPYTEPAGGGARTTYAAVTLTADLRDGNHRRIGLVARSPVTNPVNAIKADNLTVITAAVPTGETQILASLQSAFGGRTQVSSSIAVVRFVPEPDKFAPGVQFDGLNPRFYRGSSFQRRDS